MGSNTGRTWRRWAGLAGALLATAIVLAEVALLFISGPNVPHAPDALTVLWVTLMAFPALGAWAAITVWKPNSIWNHAAFMLLMLPALLLAETGFWRFGFGAKYYEYAVYSDTNWAGICSFCIMVGAGGAFALGVGHSVRSAVRRSVPSLVAAAILAVPPVVGLLNVKAVNTRVKQRFADWHYAREQAFLGQHVRGYLPDAWRKGARLAVDVGGYMIDDHWRWSATQTSFEPRMPRRGQRASTDVQVDPQAREALEDALNIAVRDRLWQQGDVLPPHGVHVVDGSVMTIELSLGPHKAHFSEYTGGEAPHLRLFLHKLGIWTNAVHRIASPRPGRVRPAPATGPAERKGDPLGPLP
jgi:hypothetical protein